MTLQLVAKDLWIVYRLDSQNCVKFCVADQFINKIELTTPKLKKEGRKNPILIQRWLSRWYVLQCVLASVLTKYVNMQYCINSRVCAAAEQGFGTIMLLRRQIKIRLPMLEFQSHGSQIDLFVEGRTTDRKKALVNKSFVCSIDGTKWQEKSV